MPRSQKKDKNLEAKVNNITEENKVKKISKKEIRKDDVIKKERKIRKEDKSEKEERDKRMVMWLGIIFFMVLIIGFWIYNIRSVFRSDNTNNKSVSQFDWEKIKGEFRKATEEVKNNMAELKKLQAPAGQNALIENQDNIKGDEINLLKQRLLEEAATSTTATSTIKN